MRVYLVCVSSPTLSFASCFPFLVVLVVWVRVCVCVVGFFLSFFGPSSLLLRSFLPFVRYGVRLFVPSLLNTTLRLPHSPASFDLE